MTIANLESQLDDLRALFTARTQCPPDELPTDVYNVWDGELDDIQAEMDSLQDAITAMRWGSQCDDTEELRWLASIEERPAWLDDVSYASLI